MCACVCMRARARALSLSHTRVCVFVCVSVCVGAMTSKRDTEGGGEVGAQMACTALSVLVRMCGSITPHDINRLVQFTLYKHHFKHSADDKYTLTFQATGCCTSNLAASQLDYWKSLTEHAVFDDMYELCLFNRRNYSDGESNSSYNGSFNSGAESYTDGALLQNAHNVSRPKVCGCFTPPTSCTKQTAFSIPASEHMDMVDMPAPPPTTWGQDCRSDADCQYDGCNDIAAYSCNGYSVWTARCLDQNQWNWAQNTGQAGKCVGSCPSGGYVDVRQYCPSRPTFLRDGMVNFTEYESFMKAMLVLFGDDTSPPDLDKM